MGAAKLAEHLAWEAVESFRRRDNDRACGSERVQPVGGDQFQTGVGRDRAGRAAHVESLYQGRPYSWDRSIPNTWHVTPNSKIASPS